MRIITLSAVLLSLVLSGCGDSKTEKLVRDQMKDPSSVQFQNIDGYCGEVNAKNGYGGYTGFKPFYISNETPVFYDEENSLRFKLGLMAHCQIKSELSDTNKAKCASLADFASSVVRSKLAGVPISTSKKSIKAETKREMDLYFKLIDDGYKSNNRESFAVSVLNECMTNKANL